MTTDWVWAVVYGEDNSVSLSIRVNPYSVLLALTEPHERQVTDHLSVAGLYLKPLKKGFRKKFSLTMPIEETVWSCRFLAHDQTLEFIVHDATSAEDYTLAIAPDICSLKRSDLELWKERQCLR